MDKQVHNNEKNLQYEIHEDGSVATLQYRFEKGNIVLMHTFVPEELRGKGLAGELAHAALEDTKARGIKAVVYCPFVAAYLKRHPEYDYLVKQ
jgi:uncharacterized protein